VTSTAHPQRLWPWLLAIFAIVLLSRVPYLDAGYGKHADGWRVARTAKMIVTTGDYQPSRPPGFPLHEWASAALWPLRTIGLNGFAAAAGAAACVLLALYARRVGCRDWPLLGLALAGLPAFYINSVSSKDFTLTIALLLGAYLLARSGRVVWTALVFGLVVASRPVAIIHGLPVALVLLMALPAAKRIGAFARFCLVSGVVVAAFYVPIFLKLGPENLRPPYRLASIRWSLIVERGTIDVWGVLGLVGLGVIVLGALIAKGARAVDIPVGTAVPSRPRTAEDSGPLQATGPEQCAWLISAAFGIGFYLWLPDQPGYCIAGLPFVLLLAAQRTSRLALRIGCVLMMAASFLGSNNTLTKKFSWLPGAIVADQRERKEEIDKVRGFAAFCATIPKPGVIVCGAWEPIISVLDLASGGQRYVFLLSPTEIAQLMKERTPIYYTPEMRPFEQRVYNIDLEAIGGTDVRKLYLEQRKAQQP